MGEGTPCLNFSSSIHSALFIQILFLQALPASPSLFPATLLRYLQLPVCCSHPFFIELDKETLCEAACCTAHSGQDLQEAHCSMVKVCHSQKGSNINHCSSTEGCLGAERPDEAIIEGLILVLSSPTKTPPQQRYISQSYICWLASLHDSSWHDVVVLIRFYLACLHLLPATPRVGSSGTEVVPQVVVTRSAMAEACPDCLSHALQVVGVGTNGITTVGLHLVDEFISQPSVTTNGFAIVKLLTVQVFLQVTETAPNTFLYVANALLLRKNNIWPVWLRGYHC